MIPIYIYIYIYNAIRKKTQTWLNCHNKFISAKNIIILFVLSDDFTCLIWGWKTAKMDYSLSLYMHEKTNQSPPTKKNKKKQYKYLNSQAKVKGVKTIKY